MSLHMERILKMNTKRILKKRAAIQLLYSAIKNIELSSSRKNVSDSEACDLLFGLIIKLIEEIKFIQAHTGWR